MPGRGPTCSAPRPVHLQPQLGGPAQFLRPELGSGEEGFAARAQARKRHHLAGRGPLSSEGPDPQPGPTPTP